MRLVLIALRTSPVTELTPNFLIADDRWVGMTANVQVCCESGRRTIHQRALPSDSIDAILDETFRYLSDTSTVHAANNNDANGGADAPRRQPQQSHLLLRHVGHQRPRQ
jgi:hypothetical protein